MATKPKADQVYVCFESFGSSDPLGGCARGARLRGDSAKVIKWPMYFLPDGADDAQIAAARRKLWADAGVSGGPQ
jgi:hypothetical protein